MKKQRNGLKALTKLVLWWLTIYLKLSNNNSTWNVRFHILLSETLKPLLKELLTILLFHWQMPWLNFYLSEPIIKTYCIIMNLK